MTTRRQQLEAEAARYRRTYDRLYVQSMKASSADECERINVQLREANERYTAAIKKGL